MKILVTGADLPFGGAVARHLASNHEVRSAGRGPSADAPSYAAADWRRPDTAEALARGVDALVHAAHFEAPVAPGWRGEDDAIERATLGTYALVRAAREAGADRIVGIGSLRIFDAYPENYLIDEMWKPRPRPEPAHLEPFLAEQSAREFVREGGLRGIGLRFRPIGDDPEGGTRLDDALRAVDLALALPFKVPGYRWHVFHVANSPRYLMRDAIRQLGFRPKETR